MRVESKRHVDSFEAGAHPAIEYRYEYDLFDFIDGDVSLVARRYTDEPSEAHFLRIEESGRRRSLIESDVQSSLCRQAIRYLAERGVVELKWLSGDGVDGYRKVEMQ